MFWRTGGKSLFDLLDESPRWYSLWMMDRINPELSVVAKRIVYHALI